MKRIASLLVLCSAAVLSAQQATPSPASSAQQATPSPVGAWTISGDVMGYPINETCTIAAPKDPKDTSGKLTGTCIDSDNKSRDTTVTITDKKIVFAHPGEYQGEALTLTFSGAYNDKGDLAGDIDVQPMNYQGTFTATRKTDKPEKTETKPQ